MNLPVTPSIDLAPLADLSLTPKKSAEERSLPLGALVGGAAAIALTWRIAPRALFGRRGRSSPWLGLGLAAVGLAVARWQLQRLFAEEPAYTLEEERAGLEIRRYVPLRIARTTVDASWAEALDQGFGRLASFIFGGNREQKRIAMTSPVLGAHEVGGYRVAFVMPEGVEAPEPDDVRITLDHVPARRVAVLRFRGRHDEQTIDAKKRELVATVEEAGYVPRGTAAFAGYDPPTTLPILRRNEVWLPVE